MSVTFIDNKENLFDKLVITICDEDLKDIYFTMYIYKICQC